jgi:peptidyl-prolyl cis-trans isomerase C
MHWSSFFVISAGVACLSAQTPAGQTPAAPPVHAVVTPGSPSVKPPEAPVPPDKVVLTIGNEKITAQEFDLIVEALPEQVQAQVRGPQKRQFAEQLVRVKVLYQEAVKRKLDQNPRLQTQIELQKENTLAGFLMQEMTANAQVDDATARQYYEQHKSDYESVHAHHILIRTKGSPLPIQPGKKELSDEEALAKAQEIRKKLLAGEDFATLAKADSDDVRSGANGGDLGFVKHNQTVPPFDQAVFSLAPGQLSEPIKTQFGYHLIKVDQHETKTFDEVKADVERKVRPELAHSAVENLEKQTTVVIDDNFFGPAHAAPAAATPSPAPAPAAPAAK